MMKFMNHDYIGSFGNAKWAKKCNDIYYCPPSLELSLVLYVLRIENASEDLGLVNNEGYIDV